VSDVFDLADAVAARVNGGSYTISDTFTVTASALVEYDMDELEDAVAVKCVPLQREVEPVSRSKCKNEITIGVAVLKNVQTSTGAVDTAAVSGLVELTEEIEDRLRSEGYTVNGKRASWLRTEVDPIYDGDVLYAHQQFRSVINATYLLTTP